MEPIEVGRGFWERIQARDWDAVRALLADDVVFDWRDSGRAVQGAGQRRRDEPCSAVQGRSGHQAPPEWRRRFTEP